MTHWYVLRGGFKDKSHFDGKYYYAQYWNVESKQWVETINAATCFKTPKEVEEISKQPSEYKAEIPLQYQILEVSLVSFVDYIIDERTMKMAEVYGKRVKKLKEI